MIFSMIVTKVDFPPPAGTRKEEQPLRGITAHEHRPTHTLNQGNVVATQGLPQQIVEESCGQVAEGSYATGLEFLE